MANYGQLIDQCLFALNRRGDPAILDAVERGSVARIYEYANHLFYAGEREDTSLILQPGQAIYALPAGTLDVIFGRFQLGNNWIPLTRMEYRTMLSWDVVNTAVGPPKWYSIFGGKIRFYLRPDKIYPVELTVESQPLPPKLATDSNFWTNDAFNLVVAGTCAWVSRLWLNDDARAARYEAEEMKQLNLLRSATNQLLGPIQPVGHL